MKSNIVVRTITLLYSCFWLLPSLARACDEFEKDFVLQKLFIIQIRGNTIDKGFIHLARRCGFDIGGKSANAIRKIPAYTNPMISTPHSLDPIIKRTADRYGIDPALVKALIHAESSFAVSAVSPSHWAYPGNAHNCTGARSETE